MEPGPEIAPVLTAVQLWQKGVAERAAARKLRRSKKVRGKFSKEKKTVENMQEICRRISQGESLQDVCDDDDMPDRMVVFDLVRTDAVFKDMYNQALMLRGEYHADRITELAEEAMLAPPELTNAYRLAQDSYKWTAARLLPRKYGDRVVVAGDPDAPMVHKFVAESDELLKKLKGGK